MQRRLAAILVADVVGYSRLMGVDEEGTLSRVKKLTSEVMRPKIGQYHGRVMKTTGDGLLAEFSSVFEAFKCAVEIQETNAADNDSRPDVPRMDLRIGINVGDIIFDEEDFFGDGVNIAARLEGLAKPGGICISGRAWEDLRKLHLQFEDMGEQHLKNIADPVRAYRVAGYDRATVFEPSRIDTSMASVGGGDGAADPTIQQALAANGVAAVPPTRAAAAAAVTPIPESQAQNIKVGDVLNHIFEVTRFIARGGMGEVFEGKNVNSDERVAIKVVLPALASNEHVITMFQREARTLTRLQHKALVQYRVLAKEPQLGVLYIVTEYVDGQNLAQWMKTAKPTPAELIMLLRLLASGLAAAHALGAIHRDMSPDNILLENGDLKRPKIIDFGIAKDLDTSVATIVGDGFAGKLNYVAPEQLGDYKREIGPWTDVYSLALVILAVASGKQVDMGRTLVEAVDKRREPVDLSKAPDELRPVLTAMLQSNPKDRLRSMDEVVAMLDGVVPPTSIDPAAPGAGAARSAKPIIIGGLVAAVLAIALVVFLLMPSAKSGNPSAAAENPVDQARTAINTALPSISCSWLDIVDLKQEGGKLNLRMTGVAGDTDNARTQLAKGLALAGIKGAAINFDEVSSITPGGCAALDSYRQIRDQQGRRLSVAQRSWPMTVQDSGEFAGKRAANAVITLHGDPSSDFALAGIEPSGTITPLVSSRANLQETQQKIGDRIVSEGKDTYRLTISLDHVGWSGLVLFTGKTPFPPEVIAPAISARGADWQTKFLDVASQNDWKSDMIWFKSAE